MRRFVRSGIKITSGRGSPQIIRLPQYKTSRNHMNSASAGELPFSRMRSEGFPFIVGGLGVGAVLAWLASCRRLSSSLVVSRRLSSSVVVSRRLSSSSRLKFAAIGGSLTLHGRVTCQFAPLFHCDLRDTDMSRKKRDALRCTGAAFCEIRRLRRSSIGISAWRVVFLGCWMWPCHWDLRFRVWHQSSVFVTSLS